MSLLAPKCPLSATTQSWMEQRMLWLLPHVGVQRVLTAEVALPTQAHFPEVFEPSGCNPSKLLEHACALMGLERRDLSLRVIVRGEVARANETYCGGDMHGAITVHAKSLEHPEMLIGSMFHELSHYLLIHRCLLGPNDPDHELTADLVPVILGLGSFGANVISRDTLTADGHDPRTWGIEDRRYLSATAYGYGLALFSWFRGEFEPAWARSLRREIRAPMKAGLRYLRSDGACPFHRDLVDAKGHASPRLSVRECLQSSRPATIVTGLRSVNSDTLAEQLHSSLAIALKHSDLAVRFEALKLVARLGRAPPSLDVHVIDALYDADDVARAEATLALGSFDATAPAMEAAVEWALNRGDWEVRNNACRVLQRWKRAPWPVSRKLVDIALQTLRSRQRNGVDKHNLAMTTFVAVTPEPERALHEFEADYDEEARFLLEQCLMSMLWPESDKEDAAFWEEDEDES